MAYQAGVVDSEWDPEKALAKSGGFFVTGN